MNSRCALASNPLQPDLNSRASHLVISISRQCPVRGQGRSLDARYAQTPTPLLPVVALLALVGEDPWATSCGHVIVAFLCM